MDMNFLESAAILLPASTGMAITIYDGDPDTLSDFEAQYCFSPQMQKIYTRSELVAFLKNSSDNLVYDLEEPLGSRLTVFGTENRWVLLGPYVEDGWNEHEARILLAGLGCTEAAVLPYQTYRHKLPIFGRDYVLKIAFLLIRHTSGGAALRKVKTIHAEVIPRWSELAIPDAQHNISIVNKRYNLESRFIMAISQGETERAIENLDRFKKEARLDLQFISDELNDQIVDSAIIRALVRMGARLAGLSAVRIDSISQEYAQKMKYAASASELGYLQMHLVARFCTEVREMRTHHYSFCVRKAIDYMILNLNQPLTIEEISQAAGMERHRMVNDFRQETGMTVKQYLAKRRCEIAAELLQDRESTVQEVAAYVGYQDNNYFSKVFKANMGVSPQSYQKEHCKTNANC